MKHPKVTIIILNWNGWEDTIECLESLYQITYPNYEVIVVDNGSEDESVEKIKEYCEGEIEVESKFFEYNPTNKPIHVVEYTQQEAERGGVLREEKYLSKLEPDKKLRLIRNDENYGFAEGNNIGMRYALKALNPSYVSLLNNDTVVDKEFLRELVKVAESDEKAGNVGSKIYYYNGHEKDIVYFGGGKLSEHFKIAWCKGINETDAHLYDEIIECDWVTGCSMLIRKTLLCQLGGFDSTFFLYCEDVDLSIRAKKRGWKNIYVPKSKVWHQVGKSSNTNRETISPTLVYHGTRSRIIFARKHANILLCFLFIICFVVYKFINVAILKKDLRLVKNFYQGAKDGLKRCSSLNH